MDKPADGPLGNFAFLRLVKFRNWRMTPAPLARVLRLATVVTGPYLALSHLAGKRPYGVPRRGITQS